MKVMIDLKIKIEKTTLGNRGSHYLLRELLPLALRIHKEGLKDKKIFDFVSHYLHDGDYPWSHTKPIVFFGSSYEKCVQHYQNMIKDCRK